MKKRLSHFLFFAKNIATIFPIIFGVLFVTASANAQEMASLVKDIYVGEMSAFDDGPSNFNLHPFNNNILFPTDDGIHGLEIWISDGIGNNTQLLKDINPNEGDAIDNSFIMIEFDGYLYFIANDGINGEELWRTDGTTAGTELFIDINTEGDANPSRLSIYNNELYFLADDGIHGKELWKTDGTIAGTGLIKDINPGEEGSYQYSYAIFQGFRFFSAYTPNLGTELWKTDGTEAGTVLVKDINPGTESGLLFNFFATDNLIYFRARGSDDFGRELWISDGTSEGTEMVVDLTEGPEGTMISRFFNIGDKVFFTTNSNSNTYTTDGTASGTSVFFDFRLFHHIDFNGLSFLSAGNNLYASDGTIAGTELILEDDLGFARIIEYDDKLVFQGISPTEGEELWESDGTAAGTQFLIDINPNGDSNPNRLLSWNNAIYFLATTPDSGEELWRYGLPAPVSGGITQTAFVECNSDMTASLSVQISTGMPPFNYDWNVPGLEGADVNGLGAGLYEVTVTDSEGAEIVLQFEVMEPEALSADLSSSDETNSDMNGTATVSVMGGTSPYIYEWATNPIQTTATAAGLSAGDYSVVITDVNGCSKEEIITVFMSTGITNLEKETIWKVSPNPSNGNFQFEIMDSDLSTDFILNIFNSNGKLITNKDLRLLSKQNFEINLSAFSKGVYFYQFFESNYQKIQSGKLIIE